MIKNENALNNILEPNNKNVVKKGSVLPSNREGQKKFVKKLNNFRNYDKERIYFKKTCEVNQWGNKIYQGYFCYDCHNELIFIAERAEKWRVEPYRFHKKFLKKGIVNTENGKKEISYFKAWCCKCAEICDCSQYLKTELEKNRQETTKREAEITENKKFTNYLKKYEGNLPSLKGLIHSQEQELERLKSWKVISENQIKHLERIKKELELLTTKTGEEA